MAMTTLDLSASMPSFTCGVLATTTSLGVSLMVFTVISTATGDAGKKLADHNGLKAAAPLYVGQKIRVPKSGKTADELAREVIRGDWSNGKERLDRLAAGYDYSAAQRRVNGILR